MPESEITPQTREGFLKDQAIVGDPEACLAQIEQIVREVGVGEIRCVFNANGEYSQTHTLEKMELFAREVLPHCRQIVPVSGTALRTRR